MDQKKIPLKRRLVLWMLSYTLIGTSLLIFMKSPLVPILVAGPLTLGVTLLPYLFKKD